jgi:heme A synthase
VAVVGLVAAEIAIGVLNVLLLAPVPLQLVHLLAADLLWLSIVLLAAATLAPGGAALRREVPAGAPA